MKLVTIIIIAALPRLAEAQVCSGLEDCDNGSHCYRLAGAQWCGSGTIEVNTYNHSQFPEPAQAWAEWNNPPVGPSNRLHLRTDNVNNANHDIDYWDTSTTDWWWGWTNWNTSNGCIVRGSVATYFNTYRMPNTHFAHLVIAIHETGHGIGLGHACACPQAMDPCVNCGTDDMSQCDAEGAAAMYGGSKTTSARLVGTRTGLNTNGSLELFVRTANGIDHVWEQSGTQTGWSGWSSLGGPAGGNPVVGKNADGRLEVFVIGSDGHLWHRWQTTPHGAWSTWGDLGDGSLTGEPAVGLNTNGSLEVFAKTTGGTLAHIWEASGTPTGWSTWVSLGGAIASNPAVGRNPDGRLEVFARATNNALVHIWQTAPHASWSTWGSFGGSLTNDPIVAPNADGRLEVFARDAGAHLVTVFEQVGGGWSPILPIGTFAFPGNPRAGWTADGRIEVMVRGYDTALWHVWQTTPNGSWTTGETLGGAITDDPDLAQNADGHLEVFVRTTGGRIAHKWIASSGWTQFGDLGGSPSGL